jgi:hypothetical protein
MRNGACTESAHASPTTSTTLLAVFVPLFLCGLVRSLQCRPLYSRRMDQQSAQRFEAWLAERGFEGERRRVRESPDGILVSKFGPGFAARLHDALDRVPELHDANGLAARYAATPAGTPRVEAWRLAVESLLAALGRERGLSRDQLSEVQAGVDSVAGLMDSVLWTSPTLGTEWTPSPAEASAYV